MYLKAGRRGYGWTLDPCKALRFARREDAQATADVYGEGMRVAEHAWSCDSTDDARTANNGVRHRYRKLDDGEKAAMVEIKDAGQALIDLISRHPGREASIARTKTEEAVMWAVKGIAK